MKIEMTGVDDLASHWKVLLAGFPGAGKTMLCSTAEEPLMVFFSEYPKIKSIARRFVPHVRIFNQERPDGTYVSVQDQLMSLIVQLSVGDHPYKTLVVDTGDELQMALKEARRWRNNGDFGISDWGWLSDTYREIMWALLALDMDVVVTFHVKSSDDGSGLPVRELLLQGSSKDEVAGWFDEVWVVEAFETTDDAGNIVTRRNILSHPTRLYPWLKDHSGIMPQRYPVSDGFVGDLKTLFEKLRVGEVIEGQERQVLDELPDVLPPEGSSSGADVPTPEQVEERKQAKAKKDPEPKPEPKPEPEPPTVEKADEEPKGEKQPEKGVEQQLPVDDLEAAAELVKEELGAEELSPQEVFVCDVCNEYIEDGDLRDITQIRFRRYLCRPHFKEALQAERRK